MQNNEHKIDELFKTQLGGFETAPSPEVWDRISNSMGIRKKKNRALLIWSMSGAAALLLAFLSGWFLANEGTNQSDLYAELDEIREQNAQQVVLKSAIDQNIQIAFNLTTPKHIEIPVIIENSNVQILQNPEIDLMVSKEIHILQDRMPTFPELIMNTETETFFTDTDRAIIESNLLALNSIDEDHDQSWAVGMKASPIYHFDNLVQSNMEYAAPEVAVQNQMTTDYQTNVSGGVSLAYNATEKLSFISGVNYSAVSLTNGGVALSYAGHNWLNDRFFADANTNKEIESSDELNYTNSTVSNNLILNTQVGLANIVLPEGATLASAKMNSLTPSIAQNYDFKQQARYVEIPMLMRYQVLRSKVGLHLLGGVNTNVLVDNAAQLKDQNETIANGKIEGLRPLTFSSSLGMGMNYEVTERVLVSLEPTLKIQLNSLNTQQFFNAKPYAFGVFSGISYQF